MKLNKYIDHTFLKPDAQQEQIEKLIEEAKAYDFASVCVDPTWVNLRLRVCVIQTLEFVLSLVWEQYTICQSVKQKNAIQNGADETGHGH